MPLERAILVDGSRLMRDLLRRVIEKLTNIDIVKEVDSLEKLPSIMGTIEVDWLFIVMLPEQAIPEEPIAGLLMMHPKLRIVSIWIDGSHVRTEWLGHHERDFIGMTLDQLTGLLQKEMWSDSSSRDDEITKGD